MSSKDKDGNRRGLEWFEAKRYGYGAGLPIAWPGWVILIGYLLAMLIAAWTLADRVALMFAITIPLTLVVVLVVWRTTRGGWRWRWGDEDRD